MTDLNLNTINVINQLEYTRTSAPNAIANGLGIMYSSISASAVSTLQYFDHHLNKIAGVISGLNAVIFISGAYCTSLEANTQGITVWDAIAALREMEIVPSTFSECVDSSIYYPFWLMTAGALALTVYHFGTQLPVNYNVALWTYNANYFNSIHTKASAYFDTINIFLIKNICFENGANVSVEALNSLYQEFHSFCHANNGFDANDTSHHNAFLNFIASNEKFDDLITLVKLGADKQDCENKTAVQTAGLNEKDFPASRSLTWLAAKSVSAQYADKDLELNETQSKIVHESRKYEKFTF